MFYLPKYKDFSVDNHFHFESLFRQKSREIQLMEFDRQLLAVISGPTQFHNPLSSTHQFNTKWPLVFSPRNPSVQHQKPLSSTNPSVQYQKPLSSTHPSIQHTPVKLRCVLNWGGCGIEGCYELRGCWTEGSVELKGFWCWAQEILGAEKVWSLNWTDVLNLRGLCGTGGTLHIK